MAATRADERGAARLDGFRTLGFVTEHEQRHSERRRLFLETAGIGQHHPGVDQGLLHGEVIERCGQLHVRAALKNGINRRLDHRVEMHGKEHVHFRVRRRHVGDRLADLFDLVSPAFPAVHGDEQVAAALDLAADTFVVAAPLLRVHRGVTGDPDVFRGDPFAEEGRVRPLCRRKMEARQPADHLPEALFRKWSLEVVGSQAGFDVGHGDTIVESGQRPLERAFGVALDHNGRPPLPRHHHIELAAAPGA